MFCWSLHLQQLVQQNLFFWILVPLGGEGGVHVCVGMVLYHCIVHILNSSKNSIFFVFNSYLCRAMLPNYLRAYSFALCQITALVKAFKKQNNGQSVPKSGFLMHAFDWPEQTLKSYMQYSTYFACNDDLRSARQTYLRTYNPQLFATFECWRRHLRRVTSAKGSQKSEF